MELRKKLLEIFLADTTKFYDCFTLSIDLGTDLHETALAIASITHEYEYELKVEPVKFYRDPKKQGTNKQSNFDLKPVSFYRLTGRTFQETAKLGDNRRKNWRKLVHFISL